MNVRRYISLFLEDHIVKDYNGDDTIEIDSLTTQERRDFFECAVKQDQILNELILDRLQALLDENLPIISSQKKYDAGFIPLHDAVNGEVMWLNRGAA